MNCNDLEGLIKQFLSVSPNLGLVKSNEDVIVLESSTLSTGSRFVQVNASNNFVVRDADGEQEEIEAEFLKRAIKLLD